MTYVGVTPQGVGFLLPPPVSARMICGEDAPADGFTGTFPLFKSAGLLTGIKIYNKNQGLCFDGIVDEQKESSGAGRKLTLAARSHAAVLLDNEAIPQTYCMPSLKTVFERHVKPYGFSGFLGDGRVFSGTYTVTKGMSEWQAAAGFCSRFLKVTPRITADTFDASGEKPQGELLFDNAAGIAYTSLSVENLFCNLLSEVLVKSGSAGNYCSAARSGQAELLGIRRRRCLAQGDADGLIRAAEKKAYRVAVDCPGEITGSLFTAAKVRDTALGFIENLYVSQTEYRLGDDGESTRFLLRR
ncbi:hypothetical protein [Caproiciproducens faecalis]|uniref:Uncharacterized protein n=1 Tax=Caproiciproducens faecalis TaxID=2820301 RepID=A0ABS7DN37_9FIRM|nr:hypothetical protein [Caproiciproducens faecalis]MBW7572715.1 hypothetical protein [Caproiciproducens faecalis]